MCDDSTTCGMTNPRQFSSIDGTPIKYSGSCSGWTQQSVRAESAFYDRSVSWIQTLRFFSSSYGGSGFGQLNWLGHVGFYVCSGNKPTCHKRGLAMDLSWVKWGGYTLKICNGAHASSSREVRRRYLAVDASLRRYFHWVLDGWFNTDHHTHIHASLHHTTPYLDKNARSDVVFVQAVCNNFNGAGLTIDGIWGSQTESAWRAINSAWGYDTSICDPTTNSSAWAEWCNQVMRHGFANVAAGAYQSTC